MSYLTSRGSLFLNLLYTVVTLRRLVRFLDQRKESVFQKWALKLIYTGDSVSFLVLEGWFRVMIVERHSLMGGKRVDSWFPQGFIDIEMFWDGGEARETCGGFNLLWDGETVPGFSIKPAGEVDDRSYNESGGNRGAGDGQGCK